MKNLLKSLFILAFVSISTVSFAQLNNVKLGLGSLAYKNINLTYERSITSNISVSANVIWNVKSRYRILKLIVPSERHQYIPTVGGFVFIPEVRYYFGDKDPLRGFYTAIYLKYASYKVASPVVNFTSKNIPTEFYIRPGFTTVGFNFGYQWIIADRVSIDWMIGGAGLGKNRFSFGFKSEDEISATRDEIANEISNSSVKQVLDYMDIDVNEIAQAIPENVSTDRFNSSKLGFTMLDFRMGLKIGYAF